MRNPLPLFFLCALFSAAVRAEPPLFDKPKFEATVGGPLTSHWEYGLADARQLNRLISHPCFEYTQPYCMPKSNTDVGFVCSGQAAVVVTHLRSLGLRAAPFYLEWENSKGGVEAHAMVIVPYLEKQQLCHHILEVARTWPHQPVVEFSHCEPGKPKTGKALQEVLRRVARDHFVNPPPHTAERERADLPARTGIPKDSPFTVRITEEAFDLNDKYNSDAPIWTLEKGKLACPQGLCKVHEVAPHIKIDQSKVVSGDRDTYAKTKIIVDYSETQQYDCIQECKAEDCTLRQTNRVATVGLKVIWPTIRATCSPAAVLRSHVVNPGLSCLNQCQTPRRDDGYQGGTYNLNAKENPMVCSTVGPVHHSVRKPPGDTHAPDGSATPNRTIRKDP